MLKKFFDRFKKEDDFPETTEIALSKIDKHMNFLLRDNLGYINKNILSKILDITQKKEEILLSLHELHRSKLINTHIPDREVHIMDGNRDNFIKRVSHFVGGIDVPKNYLDTYDYCVKFPNDLNTLNQDVQKNIFVLQHFFSNEVKTVNKLLHELEELIIDIRVLLEKNGVELLKNIQKDIKNFANNLLKTNDLKHHISEENDNIKIHEEKLHRLNEKIKTITSGTDYRALEGFKKEKEEADSDINKIVKEFDEIVSCLDTALKKYYYLNPDRKIAKEYLEDPKSAIIKDQRLELTNILAAVTELIANNQIELKENKKEKCLEALGKLTSDYLKSIQSLILKLEDAKQRSQTKITHNSASLNLSEQQYWITATEDKIKYHQTNIEKLEKNIGIIKIENEEIIEKIKTDLQKLMNKEIKIIDDLSSEITVHDTSVEEGQ